MEIIPLVPKTQKSAVLVAEIPQESGIEKQRMVAIVIHILLLQRYGRVMIIVEHCGPCFENRHSLAMNPRSIEKETGSRRSLHLHNHRRWNVVQLPVGHKMRRLFLMTF